MAETDKNNKLKQRQREADRQTETPRQRGRDRETDRQTDRHRQTKSTLIYSRDQHGLVLAV